MSKCFGNKEKLLSFLLAVLLIFGAVPFASAADDLAFLKWNNVCEESFAKATAGSTVHGRSGWTVAGEGAVTNMTSKIAANPSDSKDLSLLLERTASTGYGATAYSFASTAAEEQTGKVYISTDFYVETWSSFEVQVLTSNDTALVRAYLTSEKAWRNNAGWGKIAPASGELPDNTWFTLGIYMDTTAGTYDLYLNDTALTSGTLTKQGSAALLKTGRGVGKIKFDIDSNQSSGKFYVDNIVVKSEKAKAPEPETSDDLAFLKWNNVCEESFAKATAGSTVHGRSGWTVAGEGAVTNMTSKIAANPSDSKDLSLLLERTASTGYGATAYSFASTAAEEQTGKVYISTDFYVETWSSFEVQVLTSNDTALVRAYLTSTKAWYNNAGWKKIAPTSGELPDNTWFTLGIYLDTTAGTYDLYLNDTALTSGKLTKQGSAALLKTGRGVGKIKFDIDQGQSSGKFYVDNVVVKSETAKPVFEFLKWNNVCEESFANATAGSMVHGRSGWEVAGEGAVTNMTSKIAANPSDSKDLSLLLERTASGGYGATAYSFAEMASDEQTGKVYISTDFYVETWSSFEIQVLTSNDTPLVRAYLTSEKFWRNNAGWSKIAPTSGALPDNTWFTLGIYMDTTAGTYDLYLNDTALTSGKLTKQGSAALLKTGRGVGKIKFDIDQGQSSGKFYVDNIVVKSENAKAPDQPEPESDTNISGKEVYVRNPFSLSNPSGLGESVIGGGTWTKRNSPVTPSLFWTQEQDPDNKEGLPFSQTNQVLRARRTRVGTANEWAYTYLKAGSEVVEARGEVHVKFRVKQEYATGNFIVRVRNNGNDAWGNDLINCAIRPSGTVLNLNTWEGIGSMSVKKWNTVEFVLNTDSKTFDLYINGSKGNSNPVAFSGGGGYDCCVSVFEWDIDKNSAGENVWYMDDLEIWTNHSTELEAAVKKLKDSLSGGEVSNHISLPQLNLGEQYTVKWSSSNLDAIADNGKITPRAYRQQASLTAEIVRNADASYVEHATATCRFDFTVLPRTGATDAELLAELKETYYTDSMLSDESLQAITKALKPIAKDGPEGVSATLTSGDVAIDATTGAISRPEVGEEAKEVELTLTLKKNAATDTKVFSVKLLPKEADSVMLAEAEEWLKKEKLTDEDYSRLKYGLILPKTAPNGVGISWASDHADSITTDGKVFRKAEPVSVTLTATLSSGTESKTIPYSFTVWISPQTMAEQDAAKITLPLENLDAVTDNFPVTEKGGLYQSDIVWSSSNRTVLDISDGSAIVNQPLYEEGDKVITLTAFVRNETKAVQKTFTLTVPALPSDEDLVQTVKDWLSWNLISIDSADAVKHNLALPVSYNGGVSISWQSSDESVVMTDGRVYNPAIGSAAASVSLTASIEKNSTKQEKVFSFTVPAFASAEEVLKKTKDNLSFVSLGAQDIRAVTDHLILPKSGAGGSVISWSSSDDAYLSILEESDRAIGMVSRPAVGDEDVYVTLTASISYGGETTEKSFVMTIKAAEDWLTVYNHDYESFSVGELPINEGEAFWPTEAYLSYRVAEDPTGSGNKVAMMYRAANAPHVVNESWYFYRHKNNALYDGEMIFSGRLYLDEMLTDTIWLDIVAKNGSQICMGFYPDGKIGCQYTDGGVMTVYTKEPVLKRGEWMEFSVHMDSTTKTYHIYLNGECITENGKLILNGKTASLPWGVHYNYFQDSARSTQIQGWRIYYLGTNGGTESFAYLDDVSLKQKQTQNSKLLEAKATVERDLLSLINPYAVTKSFTMPTLSGGNVKLKWNTSNASVLRSDGTVVRGENDQTVTLTAELTMGAETIYRPFELIVKSIYATEDMTDEEIVQADLEAAVQKLQKSCNLSAVSGDLQLATEGSYGSALTWKSSDETLMTSEGVVKGKNGGTLTLTLTASKGEASAQETIVIALKSKKGSTSSAPMAVSGNNSVGNTGIVLPPIEENKTQSFSDLPKEHWAYQAVMKLTEKHVLQGTDSEHFEPERPVTRAEFAKMAVAAFDLIPTDNNAADFTDVQKTDWYYQYVRTLSALGLIQGMEDGSFGAGQEISRQDMAVILYRVLQHKAFTLSEEPMQATDWDAIADYAKEAVGSLLSDGILKGDENGNFAGQASATRAQAAMMLYNCLNLSTKVR